MKKFLRLFLLLWLFGITSFTCLAIDLDQQRPREHICCMTLSRMDQPVIAADGHSYERTAMEEWIRVSRRPVLSPMTGAPLSNLNLIPNHALRILIRDWVPAIAPEPVVVPAIAPEPVVVEEEVWPDEIHGEVCKETCRRSFLWVPLFS